MTPTIKYFGKVESGKLKIVHRNNFDNDLKLYEGKEVEITIQKKVRKRSNMQNSFHFGVILPILKQVFYEAGSIYTTEQIHGRLKAMFLQVTEPIGNDGQFITRIKSSTELSTTQWMDWNTQITVWAGEFFGIRIPEPNEQTEIEI